ncbi:hypothetical protein K488DRAFT_74296 [Vararia minispora EC-137]|uniref:Uncharacterized protein n=1 Tax=Vararia minispora EC-137 TaxID=1314806 RepID=A0ACB8Q959_9AGAM|nr:hypothetical protein K488DRAFT_74296 [Vararia minispora EC-137]
MSPVVHSHCTRTYLESRTPRYVSVNRSADGDLARVAVRYTLARSEVDMAAGSAPYDFALQLISDKWDKWDLESRCLRLLDFEDVCKDMCKVELTHVSCTDSEVEGTKRDWVRLSGLQVTHDSYTDSEIQDSGRVWERLSGPRVMHVVARGTMACTSLVFVLEVPGAPRKWRDGEGLYPRLESVRFVMDGERERLCNANMFVWWARARGACGAPVRSVCFSPGVVEDEVLAKLRQVVKAVECWTVHNCCTTRTLYRTVRERSRAQTRRIFYRETRGTERSEGRVRPRSRRPRYGTGTSDLGVGAGAASGRGVEQAFAASGAGFRSGRRSAEEGRDRLRWGVGEWDGSGGGGHAGRRSRGAGGKMQREGEISGAPDDGNSMGVGLHVEDGDDEALCRATRRDKAQVSAFQTACEALYRPARELKHRCHARAIRASLLFFNDSDEERKKTRRTSTMAAARQERRFLGRRELEADGQERLGGPGTRPDMSHGQATPSRRRSPSQAFLRPPPSSFRPASTSSFTFTTTTVAATLDDDGADVDDTSQDLAASYVLLDHDAPAAANGPARPASRLIHMFRRKKRSEPPSASAAASTSKLALPLPELPDLPLSRPSFLSPTSASVSALGHAQDDDDDAASLAPRAASALSLAPPPPPRRPHKLPDSLSQPDVRAHSHPPPPPQQQAKKQKGGGFFSWAARKSRPPPQTPAQHQEPEPDHDHDASFSLRAFRHITTSQPTLADPLPPRPPSALSAYDASLPLDALPPPRPRPRGTSSASDASQRISVAAFREAQARRSNAPSPSPVPVPAAVTRPGVGPLGVSEAGRAYSSPASTSAGVRKTARAVSGAGDETSDEDPEEEEESESEEEETLRPARRRTVRGRGRGRAEEMGVRAATGGANGGMGARSVSAGAGIGSAGTGAGVRASPAPTPAFSRSRATLVSTSSSSSSSGSGSDSDDDAPLASFMLPTRPSSATSGRVPVPAKPLVDLGDLRPSAPRKTLDELPSAAPRKTTDAPRKTTDAPRKTADALLNIRTAGLSGAGPTSPLASPAQTMSSPSQQQQPSPAQQRQQTLPSPVAPAPTTRPRQGSVGLTERLTMLAASIGGGNGKQAEGESGREVEREAEKGRDEPFEVPPADKSRELSVSPSPSPSRSPAPAPAPTPVSAAKSTPSLPTAKSPAASGKSTPPSTSDVLSRSTASDVLSRSSPSDILSRPPPRSTSLGTPVLAPHAIPPRASSLAPLSISLPSSEEPSTPPTSDDTSPRSAEFVDVSHAEIPPVVPRVELPPIVPIPVRERPAPPPSFAVTSRPVSHARSESTSTIGAATGLAPSNAIAAGFMSNAPGLTPSNMLSAPQPAFVNRTTASATPPPVASKSSSTNSLNTSSSTSTSGAGKTPPSGRGTGTFAAAQAQTIRMVRQRGREEQEEELPRPYASTSPGRAPVVSRVQAAARSPTVKVLAGRTSPTESSRTSLTASSRTSQAASSRSSQTESNGESPAPAKQTPALAKQAPTSAKQAPAPTKQALKPTPPQPVKQSTLPLPKNAPLPKARAPVKQMSLPPPGVGSLASTSSSAQSTASSSASSAVSPSPPLRPFAMRDYSPASSTGGSTSSRMPATPRDGSELGVPRESREQRAAEARRLGHKKRASVSFADEDGGEGAAEVEQRRRERRRSEARAAIELGNVINGKAPLVDEEDGVPLNAHMAVPFPSGFPQQYPMQPGSMPTSMPLNAGMNMPMNPMMMPADMGINVNMAGMDPRMMAAHQQAMLIAKQTYQWAVAQQAMREAGDEWERGSTWGGSRAPSVFMGSGASVVGAPSGGSPTAAMGMSPMGMNMGMPNMSMGMPNMGMGMPNMPPMPMNMSMGMGAMGTGWPMFGSAQSMYAPSVYVGSEIGGPTAQRAQWSSSRSEYGGGDGGGQRASRAFRSSAAGVPPMPPVPASASGGVGAARDGPRVRTMTAPSGTAAASAGALPRSAMRKKTSRPTLLGAVAPPSSWRGEPSA